MKPGQRWFPIAGEEYFTVARPGFVWNARVRLAPMVWAGWCVGGERYRDTGGGQAVLTPWIARCGDYRDFDGLRVPASVEVGWKLDEGECIYARFRVTALEYNVNARAPRWHPEERCTVLT